MIAFNHLSEGSLSCVIQESEECDYKLKTCTLEQLCIDWVFPWSFIISQPCKNCCKFI